MTGRGRIARLASGLVATLRRRREDRGPRVRVYDAAGTPRALDPGSGQGAALLAAATRVLDAAGSSQRTDGRL